MSASPISAAPNTGFIFPAAFGADYLTDYLRDPKTMPEINPHSQHIGAFQSLCLSGIRARLVTLKSLLEALESNPEWKVKYE